MQVKDLMKDVNALNREMTLAQAEKEFISRNLDMLPVVCCNRLVGVLTRTELERALPSHASSLSKWEMNHLLDKTGIGELIRDALTVSSDMYLSDLVKLAIEHKTYNFPVVKGNQRAGMIYEDVIFRYLSEKAEKPALKVEVNIMGKEKSNFSLLKFIGLGGVL